MARLFAKFRLLKKFAGTSGGRPPPPLGWESFLTRTPIGWEPFRVRTAAGTQWEDFQVKRNG